MRGGGCHWKLSFDHWKFWIKTEVTNENYFRPWALILQSHANNFLYHCIIVQRFLVIFIIRWDMMYLTTSRIWNINCTYISDISQYKLLIICVIDVVPEEGFHKCVHLSLKYIYIYEMVTFSLPKAVRNHSNFDWPMIYHFSVYLSL